MSTESSPERSESLIEVWNDAIKVFQDRAQHELHLDTQQSLENVLATLDAKFRPDRSRKDAAQTKRRVHEKFVTICNMISSLGDVAVKGASIVYPPAGVCFSALKILLDAPGKILKVYTTMEDLVEEMAQFRGRFDVLKQIDAEHLLNSTLIDSCHRILIKLVDICGLMISLMRKNKWTKMGSRLWAVVADDDSGLGDALKEFKRLVDYQHALTAEITHLHSARADASTSILAQDAKVRQNKESTIARLQNLARKLKVPSEILTELTEAPQMRLVDIADNLVNGSREELKKIDQYVEWRNSPPGPTRLLHVSAAAAGGKTSLLANIRADTLESDGEFLVTYYDFGNLLGHTSQQDGFTGNEASMALKATALQLAQCDSRYAVSLEDRVSGPVSFPDHDLTDVWKRSFCMPGGSDSKKVLMLFDNVDKLPSSASETFMSIMQERCNESTEDEGIIAWIMTAATPRMNHSIRDKNIVYLDLHGCLEMFTSERIVDLMKGHDILHQDHPSISQLRSQIQKSLPKLAKGNIGLVKSRLDQVVKCLEEGKDSLNYLMDVVSQDPAADQAQLARQSIQDLERDLSSKEIGQLNTLLQWTLHSEGQPTMEQLDQALLLSSTTDHVLPLKDKIQRRYLDIFDIQPEFIIPRDGVVLYLKQAANNAGINVQSTKKSSVIKVEDPSRMLVQHLILQLKNALSTGDLQLDFTAPQEETDRSKIFVSEADACNAVAGQCLRLLTDDEEYHRYDSLTQYALQVLPYLLKRLRRLAERGEITLDARKLIAERLINLLTDTDSWISHFRSHSDQVVFMLYSDMTDSIHYWLEDPNTLQRLEPVDRRRAKQMTAAGEPKSSLWFALAVEIARLWLRERTGLAGPCCRWITAFLDMQKGRPLPRKAQGPDFWHPRIHAAAVWSRDVIGLQSPDSLYFERVGFTFLDMINDFMMADSRTKWSRAAIEQFNQAQTHDSYDWNVDRGLANAYKEIGDIQLAKDSALKGVAKLQVHLKANNSDKEAEKSLLTEYKRIASWQASAGNHEEASHMYGQVLVIDPDDYECRWRRFLSLYAGKEKQKAHAELIELNKRESDHKGWTQLGKGLQKHITEALERMWPGDNGSYILQEIVKDQQFRSIIFQALHDSVADARREQCLLDKAKLLLLQGVLFAQRTADESDLAKAHNAWQKCLHLSEDRSSAVWMTLRSECLQHEGNYHFNSLMKPSTTPASSESKSRSQLEQIAGAAESLYGGVIWGPATYLSAYHWSNDRRDLARKRLKPDFDRAVEILTDDDPDNDDAGYQLLASSFTHIGDSLNALSVWSLLAPPRRQTVSSSIDEDTGTGRIRLYCDGLCGHKWKYADDIWKCKYCPNTDFCTACKEKLERSQLERYRCDPTHDWLHIPPASVLELDPPVRSGYIRVGGQIREGRRVGGKEVKLETWLMQEQQEWKESSAVGADGVPG